MINNTALDELKHRSLQSMSSNISSFDDELTTLASVTHDDHSIDSNDSCSGSYHSKKHGIVSIRQNK